MTTNKHELSVEQKKELEDSINVLGVMKAVVQEERSGCGIASVAVLAGITYRQSQRVANNLGIYAETLGCGQILGTFARCSNITAFGVLHEKHPLSLGEHCRTPRCFLSSGI